ncbi:MAG: hypothetical protein WCL11_25175, partial [Verrucomicrobiota bacterium]
MARITRMGTGFVMVVNLFRGHPPGEHPLHCNPFFKRHLAVWPSQPILTERMDMEPSPDISHPRAPREGTRPT